MSQALVLIEPSALQALIAAAVREAMSSAPPPPALDWIDQTISPLGKKRHAAAVRRRIASGQPGAAVIGRRYVLSPTALEAELAALKEPAYRAGRVERSSRSDVIGQIERELEGQ